MNVAAVITVGTGRERNLARVLASLRAQSVSLPGIVVVFDGPGAVSDVSDYYDDHRPLLRHVAEKHEPGKEQPRNVGAAIARDVLAVDHVWFVDSDVVMAPAALEHYLATGGGRILLGPYDWLAPNADPPGPLEMRDPRWADFDRLLPDTRVVEDLSAGTACFGGNLVWPLAAFYDVGGFWNDLHHGRCEDGELGVRAVAERVPISFVAGAQGWHLWHPRNHQLALERNRRDVPMLNARHPWIETEGLVMVDKDGCRFDQRCPECGELVNSIEYFEHRAAHTRV